jgi:hypothetical protein
MSPNNSVKLTMPFVIALGETAAKLHPEANLYIDNHLAYYSDSFRQTLGLHGEILHDPDEQMLAQRLDAISGSQVEVITTLQGRYGLSLFGPIMNHLIDRGTNVLVTIEPILEITGAPSGVLPRIRLRRSLEASVAKSRQLRVFLCHTTKDKPLVRDLYRRLQGLGAEVWFDEESLLPGQDWNAEIRRAIGDSDLVIVCLSRRAVDKVGYVQKEIRLALDCADEQPGGALYIVPVKLEECEVPNRLKRWHWVNLWEDVGPDRLAQTLHARASDLRRREMSGGA